MNTPAIREILVNNENIILSEPENPDSLAEAVLRLKNNEILRNKIKNNAYRLFQEI